MPAQDADEYRLGLIARNISFDLLAQHCWNLEQEHSESSRQMQALRDAGTIPSANDGFTSVIPLEPTDEVFWINPATAQTTPPDTPGRVPFIKVKRIPE